MTMLQMLPVNDNEVHGRRPNQGELMDVENKLYMDISLNEDDRQVLLRLIEKAPYKRQMKAPKESYEKENDRLKKLVELHRGQANEYFELYRASNKKANDRFLVWNRMGRAIEAFFTTIRNG